MSMFFMLVRGETQPEDTKPEHYNEFAGGRTEAVYGREDALLLAQAYGYSADAVYLLEVTDEMLTERQAPEGQTEILREYNTGNDHPCLFTKSGQQMVSFFDKPLDYVKNRRTEMKVGRYLERLRKSGRLDGEEWQIYDIQMSLGVEVEGLDLKFATTREEVRRVYVNGPSSCMSGTRKILAANTPQEIHPTELYAMAGLQVAYIEMNNKIIARAVVNPERKAFVRVYGADRLINNLLEKHGYQYSAMCFVGVKFPVVPTPASVGVGYFVMPYIDGPLQRLNMTEDGQYWEIKSANFSISGNESGYNSPQVS